MFRLPSIEAPAGDGKQPVASSSGGLTLFAGAVSEPYFDNNCKPNRCVMSSGNKAHKPLKDRDLETTTYFLRVAGLTVPFVCLLGLFTGYVYWGLPGAVFGVVLALLAGLVISGAVMFLMNAASGAASGLISGRREAVWTVREQVQGFLSQARFNRENKDYPAALSFVNKVLEKDPDFTDALFLKAQILWEGFGQSHASIQFLEKTLSLENENKMLQNQALMLRKDLEILEISPGNMSIPEGIEIGLRSRKSFITQKLTQESFQGLKARAEETPMAWWAIYVSIIFGLFLACILASMTLQIRNFDHASTLMGRSVENTLKSTRTHARKIEKVEKSIQTLTAELSRIGNRLNKKK